MPMQLGWNLALSLSNNARATTYDRACGTLSLPPGYGKVDWGEDRAAGGVCLLVGLVGLELAEGDAPLRAASRRSRGPAKVWGGRGGGATPSGRRSSRARVVEARVLDAGDEGLDDLDRDRRPLGGWQGLPPRPQQCLGLDPSAVQPAE